jgi:diguanylate cyclase (GGDEF)-like protein
VAPLILIVCISLLICVLTYLFLREEKQLINLQIQTNEMTDQLNKYQETTQHLRQELTSKQTELISASRDSVTQLLGWQLFEDRLNQNIKESERYQLTLGVLFVDIDDFELINEALSYSVGDELLQEVAHRLEACIRKVDSVCRYNKDTFVVLLTQLGKPEMAAVVAQRILQSLAQSFQIKEHELFITVGIGIAIYPTDGQDGVTICNCAERALRVAKQKGKHLYQFAQEKLLINSQRDLALTNSLRRDFIPQEFVILYQPIMNTVDNTVFCMDTNLQWQHPELGLIQAQELFANAAKQGKLNVITEWLLRSACEQFLQWQSLGFKPQFISIPLAVKQLENTHFIYRISQMLQELKFDPQCLILALKDISSLTTQDVLEKSLNMLKYINVKLAVDDFGANSFALRDLKNITVDYLRLDPSFVADIEKNPQSLALIKSIVFLAENMQVKLIAQGIESEQQAILLREQGCTLMQGQLMGAALPEKNVLDILVETTEER